MYFILNCCWSHSLARKICICKLYIFISLLESAYFLVCRFSLLTAGSCSAGGTYLEPLHPYMFWKIFHNTNMTWRKNFFSTFFYKLWSFSLLNFIDILLGLEVIFDFDSMFYYKKTLNIKFAKEIRGDNNLKCLRFLNNRHILFIYSISLRTSNYEDLILIRSQFLLV